MSQTEPEAANQVLQWITLLQGHVDEYGGLLSLTDFDSFQADLQEIAGALRDHPDSEAESQTNLIELISRYPSVGQWLVGVDPAYRDLPGVNEPLAVEPAADAAESESTPADAVVAEPVAVKPVVVKPVVVEPEVAEPQAAPAAKVAAPPVEATVTQERSAPAAAAPSTVTARFWTPDFVMQVGKEVVTAIIALVIIGSTIALVARSFGLIGNASHINQAKDLVGIMLGLVGTVIGYYFGRVPADARATTATARADQATKESAQVKARARSLADHLDDVMTSTSLSSLNAISPNAVATHKVKLQNVRDDLRTLGSS
jgi:hypothetical protein